MSDLRSAAPADGKFPYCPWAVCEVHSPSSGIQLNSLFLLYLLACDQLKTLTSVKVDVGHSYYKYSNPAVAATCTRTEHGTLSSSHKPWWSPVVVGAGLLMIMKQSMLAQLFEPLMIILRRRHADLY